MSNLQLWRDQVPYLYAPYYQLHLRPESRSYPQQGYAPPQERIYRALELLAPSDVRVVILGQDPYHTPGKASGLAFGYHPDYVGPVDSSLANILWEMGFIAGLPDSFDFSLEYLPPQGVLLLNSRLTVELGKPMSHAGILGWEQVVTAILKLLRNRTDKELIWLLWGREAQRTAQGAGIDLEAANVICTSHPSKYSATNGLHPFTGSNCFQRVNKYIRENDLGPEIRWIG